MKRIISHATALIMLLCFATSLTYAKKWTVNVRNNSFVPYNLTHVQAGDTIQWVWEEGVHTTTSVSIPEGAISWDTHITQDKPSFIYIPNTNGTYFYHCTHHANTMKGTFVVSGASGIASNTELSQISLFPNPSTSYLTIRFDNPGYWVKSLKIYSMKGEIIREMRYKSASPAGMITVDLKDLAPGVYLMHMIDNVQHNIVKQVVRN